MKLLRATCEFLGLMIVSGLAFAIDVSGLIDGNVIWRSADSPINVTADLEVRGTLKVEPGVLVLMSAGSSLKVTGQLIARGTQLEPVRITSFNEGAGRALAQPGDWGTLSIEPRSLPAPSASVLRHVEVSYGQGMLINSGAPELEFVALNHHSAAALRVGQLANPTGSSLSATGNTLNGIEVQAGFVQGNMAWRMKGIPYVVRGGLLRIGDRPLRFEPEPQVDLLPATQTTVKLVLTEPAPVGGLVATLTQTSPSVLSLSPTVLHFAVGEMEKTFGVSSLALGLSTITASVPSLGQSTLTVLVGTGPRLVWDPNPIAIPVNRVTMIDLRRTPSATPASASLSATVSGVVTLPASVDIGSSVLVPVTATSVGTTSIEASLPGLATGVRSITVRPSNMSWPVGMEVPPGRSVPYLLTFSDPVPPGGGTVTLSTGDNTIATVPASLPVPAGANQLSVSVTGVALGSTTLSAVMSGYSTASAPLQVQNLNLSFDVSNYALPSGLSEPFSVRLSRAAPTGGVMVNLATSDGAIATVSPAQLTIHAGATESSTVVEVAGIAGGTATITAQASAAESGNLQVQVGSPVRFAWYNAEINVPRGLVLTGPGISLLRADESEYRGRRDRVIALSSADPSKLTVPATVTIPRGAPGVGVELQGTVLSANGIIIQPTSAGVTVSSTPYAPKVVEPILNFINLDGSRGRTPFMDTFYLQFSIPNALTSSAIRLPSALVANLSVVDATPQGIIPGFFAANGTTPTSLASFAAASNRSSDLHVAPGTAVGNYRVRAQMPGFPPAVSDVQRVDDYELSFVPAEITLGKQMRTDSVSVRLLRNNQPFASPDLRFVGLTVSDESKLTAPASVNILPGASSAVVPLTGLALSTGVQLNSVLANNQLLDSGIPVNVRIVEPDILFDGLDGQRVVGAQTDHFALRLVVPNSSLIHRVRQPTTIGVNLHAPTPVNIVSGILGQGAIPIIETTINEGAQTQILGIPSPTSLGSYAVRASLSGNANSPWISELQTVAANALLFSPSERLGVGFEEFKSLSLAAPQASNVPVTLSCVPNTVCSVPNSVTIPAGGAIDVRIQGMAEGTATITATPQLPGVAAITRELTVVMPEFEFDQRPDEDCIRGFCGRFTNDPGGQPIGALATFSLVNVQPSGALTIVRNATQEFRPADAYNTAGCWPPGSSSSDLSTCVSGAPESTRYRVRVRYNDIGPEFTSEEFSGVRAGPLLAFDESSFTVGRGLSTSVHATAYRNGQPLDVNEGLVTWSCINAALCTPPQPAVMTGGQAQGHLIVLGNGTTELRAIADGYEPAMATLVVVDPLMQHIRSVPNPYAVGNLDAYLYVYLNGHAVAPIPLTVTASVNGIVSFPATNVIPAGDQATLIRLTALTPGTVTLTISASGFAPITSAPIMVVP